MADMRVSARSPKPTGRSTNRRRRSAKAPRAPALPEAPPLPLTPCSSYAQAHSSEQTRAGPGRGGARGFVGRGSLLRHACASAVSASACAGRKGKRSARSRKGKRSARGAGAWGGAVGRERERERDKRDIYPVGVLSPVISEFAIFGTKEARHTLERLWLSSHQTSLRTNGAGAGPARPHTLRPHYKSPHRRGWHRVVARPGAPAVACARSRRARGSTTAVRLGRRTACAAVAAGGARAGGPADRGGRGTPGAVEARGPPWALEVNLPAAWPGRWRCRPAQQHV